MRAALLTILLLAACSAEPQQEAAVRTDGIDNLKIGMTLAEAQKAAGHELLPEGADECKMAAYNQAGDVLLMFEKNVLTRIDVINNSQLTTLNGAKIGDSEDRIRQLFPKIESTPHKYEYEKGAEYLTFKDSNGYKLLFETDGNAVTRYRVGTDSVNYVEGCS